MASVGDRIRARRTELGLSVDDLAAKLGKNRATIYRYESNDIENLPITVLGPLAKVLQTTPAVLMGWEEPSDSTVQEEENQYRVLAAHLEDDDYTEEELEEIRRFAEYLKTRRGE